MISRFFLFIGAVLFHSSGAIAQDVKLDTPINSFTTCRSAFKNSDLPVLRRCLLGGDKIVQFKPNTIRMWQMSFEACGGFDRKILGIEERPFGYTGTPSPDRVWVKLEPVGGCQSEIQMEKHAGEWKWADN